MLLPYGMRPMDSREEWVAEDEAKYWDLTGTVLEVWVSGESKEDCTRSCAPYLCVSGAGKGMASIEFLKEYPTDDFDVAEAVKKKRGGLREIRRRMARGPKKSLGSDRAEVNDDSESGWEKEVNKGKGKEAAAEDISWDGRWMTLRMIWTSVDGTVKPTTKIRWGGGGASDGDDGQGSKPVKRHEGSRELDEDTSSGFRPSALPLLILALPPLPNLPTTPMPRRATKAQSTLTNYE
ncbi:hypothetical protein IAT38_005889 [Cryptococcus sp. DSM 104549]